MAEFISFKLIILADKYISPGIYPAGKPTQNAFIEDAMEY